MQQVAAMIACGGTMVFAGRDDDALSQAIQNRTDLPRRFLDDPEELDRRLDATGMPTAEAPR